jgi:hypothetical protein
MTKPSSPGDGGKLPGKTQWASKRRPTTRRSGFTSHPDSTGGELRVEEVGGWQLGKGAELTVDFDIPPTPTGTLLGFGGWFLAPSSVQIALVGVPGRYVLTTAAAPDWSKFGSQWYSDGRPASMRLTMTSSERATVALYSLHAGVLDHPFLRDAGPKRMKRKHEYAPEANFISAAVHAQVSEPQFYGAHRTVGKAGRMFLKSCNRCARFLPINVNNEKLALSFSNHCTAAHKVPCSHTGFGRLLDLDTGERVQFENGFQLECRFCKKFAVNDAHNDKRTGAQLKEDAARRRHFELLIAELSGGSPSQAYFEATGGKELTDDVWEKFGRQCFKCDTHLATPKEMNLDHTRPLALLWPLDETATALCATHNSEKRDRSPNDYYDDDELERLSKITGIPLPELRDPSPNPVVVRLLEEKLEWFFGVFLQRPELQKVRDGKLTADLMLKALEKTLNRTPGGPPFDITKEYSAWQRRNT